MRRLGNPDRWCEGPRRVHFPDHPHLRITHVAAGHKHSLVLDQAGHIWVFGGNKLGELGLGRQGLGTPIPERVGGEGSGGVLSGYRVVSIACGAQHSVSLSQSIHDRPVYV